MPKFFDDETGFKDATDEDIYVEDDSDDFDIGDFEDYEEYDEDIWADELKYKLENAIDVWIASAYLDFRAVEVLKNNLLAMPKGYSREIRILLDNEFHTNEIAREVIINKLYEIPNIKIRLADTKGKFHPKCYVFNDGSMTSCLVGSMNMTGAAMKYNVEFGLFVNEQDQISKCKKFFRKHWRTSIKAVKTERTEYKQQKFNENDQVIYEKTGETGVVLKIRCDPENKYIYSVFFSQTKVLDLPENELKKVHISTPSTYDIHAFPNISSTKKFQTFVYDYLHSRYYLPSENGLYISNNSRIVDTWYQKIPLIKVMASSRPKLLIADEVGLGKTIEAGLIIREMFSKMPLCRKVLIICPNNLVNKWEAEMRIRFDLFFDIFTGRETQEFIQNWNNKASFMAIMSYESLRKKGLPDIISEKNTSIDVLVCDEAHHLRNSGNNQHKSVRAIAKANRCMIMLTATPINLSSDDLRVLLGLLDPEHYKNLDPTSWNFFKTPNIFISRLYTEISDCLDNSCSKEICLNDGVIDAAKKLQDNILESIGFGHNYDKDHPIRSATDEIIKNGKELPLSSEVIINYLEKIQFSNVFSQSITRTLKKDVGEFNNREVITIKVKLKYPSEIKQFEQLIEDIKKFYNKKQQNKLVVHTYLRQVSSCLPMCISFTQLQDVKKDDGDLPKKQKSKSSLAINDEILNAKDSKYEELKRIIIRAKEEDGDNFKIVIFCIFRNTIKYLMQRINKEFGENSAEAVYGLIDDIDERYMIIKKFRELIKPNILICSEVASEGVDLQTCRILINYDLPWNPTKVEQRIGRIDRFGQESEVVYVYNLVVENTIEEAIYQRLDYRLEDARNTLGPVADVLGDMREDLPEIFLKNEMSSDEKTKYLNKLKRNLERAEREEKKTENRCFNLNVTSQKFLTEKWELVPYLVDHEEKVAGWVVSNSENIMRLFNVGDKKKLKIARTKKHSLLKQIKKDLYKKDLKKKYLNYQKLINKNAFDVVLNHREALKYSGVYLNINNPIIKSQFVKNTRCMNRNVCYNFETVSKSVNPGIYIIIEYECLISLGTTKHNNYFFESAIKIDNDNNKIINNKKIISELFDFTQWRGSNKIDVDNTRLSQSEEIAKEQASEHFLSQYEKIKEKVNTELQLKKDSLKSMHSREISNYHAKLKDTVDPNQTKNIQNSIELINNEIENSLSNIPSIDSIVFSPNLSFCAKIIRK